MCDSSKVSLDVASAILSETDVLRPQLPFILFPFSWSVWNSGRRSPASAAARALLLLWDNQAPSVDVDALKVLTELIRKRSHRLTASKKLRAIKGRLDRQRHVALPPERRARCNCERMTMWQNDAEGSDKRSKLSWQQLQRPDRLRGVLGNLISCTVTN